MAEKQIPEVEAVWKAVYGDEVPELVTCSLGHVHPLRDLQPVTVDQDEKCYQSVDGPDATHWGLQCPECQGRALNSVPLPGNL